MGIIRHPELADEGEKRVRWAMQHMPAIIYAVNNLKSKKPLRNVRIGACLHVTKETAVLMLALKDLGASVKLAASNPLSTQDDVAAYLEKEGVEVFAWRGETEKEYREMIHRIIDERPQIVLDDGGDLHVTLHEERRKEAEGITGGTEETTTGVVREKALWKAGRLLYPIIAVNNALTKTMLDNKYGTGQSTIDGILRATSLLIAGKNVVVAGYGWVARGVAARARGMGARVMIAEVDPIKALNALLDGFEVLPMEEAAGKGDIFITATGQINVIRKEHMLKMKDGAILANSGHFNVEISLEDLNKLSKSKREVKKYVDEYTLTNGRRLYLLGKGRLINLVAAEGHPPEVMMCSFLNQLLSAVYLQQKKGGLQPNIYNVPKEIDETVARYVLRAWGVRIDEMTEEQKRYAELWK